MSRHRTAVRASLGLSQDALGARLGVSRRTLTRWEIHDELPPVGQRKHLATSFPDAPAELRARLVRSLELDDAFVASLDLAGAGSGPAPVPRLASAGSPGAVGPWSGALADVDGAFLDLCDRVDVAPGRLRAGLAAFLRRVEAGGLPLAAVSARIEPKAPKATRG